MSKNTLRVGDLPCDLIFIAQSFVHSRPKAIPRKRRGTRIKERTVEVIAIAGSGSGYASSRTLAMVAGESH